VSLKLEMLVPQLEEMGREFASRQKHHTAALDQARDWLHRYADKWKTLAPLAGNYRVASPTRNLDAIHPAPARPERLTVIGSDGSVVPPNRHGPALYYLINVGGLVFRTGSGETPQAFHSSRLGYSRSDLYDGARLVEGNLLDVRRDQAELLALADYVEGEHQANPDIPMVALADGTLLLWVMEESPPEKRQARFTAYLDELDRFAALQTPIVGFISRPRYRGVLRLLWLADLQERGALGAELPADDPLQGLTDRDLFAGLPAGARTSLYISTARVNAIYQARRHQVHFCYLNVGRTNDPEIARLELPEWVAARDDLLDLAHAAVVDQCRVPGGYPYVLARAHEQAVVTTEERRHLEGLVVGALIRQGMIPRPSRKARMKELTGSAWRRHHL